jgi:hypothetical protein
MCSTDLIYAALNNYVWQQNDLWIYADTFRDVTKICDVVNGVMTVQAQRSHPCSFADEYSDTLWISLGYPISGICKPLVVCIQTVTLCEFQTSCHCQLYGNMSTISTQHMYFGQTLVHKSHKHIFWQLACLKHEKFTFKSLPNSRSYCLIRVKCMGFFAKWVWVMGFYSAKH